MKTKPRIEDFYDTLDPRGISTSEYNEFMKALSEWEKNQAAHEITACIEMPDGSIIFHSAKTGKNYIQK